MQCGVAAMLASEDTTDSLLTLYRISRKDRHKPTLLSAHPKNIDVIINPSPDILLRGVKPTKLYEVTDTMNFYDAQGIGHQLGLSGVRSKSTLDLSTHKWKSWTSAGTNPLTTQQMTAAESAHGEHITDTCIWRNFYLTISGINFQ